MKRYIAFSFFCLSVWSACKFSDNENNTTTPTPNITTQADTLQINSEDINLFAEQLPILSQLLQGNALHNTIAVYANKVLRGKVSSQKDLETLLDSRSKMITLLHDKVLNPFFSKADTEDFYNSERGASLEKELNRIGIQSVSAEGIYIGLAPSTMLEKEFKQLSDEPFKLYNEFLSQRGSSMGGEYPYSNLENQMQLVWIGEQLIGKYPNNPYTARIRSDFRFALGTLTDFHEVSTPAQGVYYIVSDLLTEPYPTMTSVEQLNNFVEKYPQNTSDIKLNEDAYPQPIYLVVAKWLAADSSDENADCENAEQLRNNYLDKAMPIPHLLRLNRQGQTQCALCYRFYSSAQKATTALSILKKIEPAAEGIFKATYNANTNTWTAE